MSGRSLVALVARREITERAFEKSFLVGTLITVVIVVLVAVLPTALGFGGRDLYTVDVADPSMQPVAEAAVRAADAFDADLRIVSGSGDVRLEAGGVVSDEEPPEKLVNILQAANAQVSSAAALREAGLSGTEARSALSPEPLHVSTAEPVDEDAQDRGGFAFIAVILLYGQLITMGYFVAMGVVEEKSTRVVEIVLSTLRPRHLLAGKIIGLGLLGFVQLLAIAAIGIGAATAAGALDVDGDVLFAAALALAWFVVGYAFYAVAFGCAAALVSRQEDLQSVMSPLSILLMIGFFVSFAVLDDPDGTLAQVVSFIPPFAPMTMPPRIAVGEASAVEIAGALAVTVGATALLLPLAARIYRGGVLRTGAAMRYRDAWRAARGGPVRR